jgi:hypothetical protein
MTSGQSFSSNQYGSAENGNFSAALAQSYALASSSGSVSGYYPNGSDPHGNLTGVIQPASGSKNMNLNSFAVASMVTSITNSAGATIYTDPYPNGNKLSIYGPYTGITSGGGTAANTGLYSPGASAAIIAGTFVPNANLSSTGITMQWRTRSQNEMVRGSSTTNELPSNSGYLASDVLQMSGQQPGNDFVLQMSFDNEFETPSDQVADIASGALYLGMLYDVNGQTGWTNAVKLSGSMNPITHRVTQTVVNTSAVGAYSWDATGHSGPYLGSFQSFLNSTYGGQAYSTHSLDQLRGSWGVDTTNDTVWAVLDVGGGTFAVVPEPASIRLLAAGMLSLAVGFWWRRRARIKAARAGKLSIPTNSNSSERLAVA